MTNMEPARVSLRPATMADRRTIFAAMARSELTDVLVGHPSKDHTPLVTFEAFCDDYVDHFFDGSAPLMGRSFVIVADGIDVGHINYNDIDEKTKTTELDIWMFGQEHCGQGYGPRAIDLLCRQLRDEFGVRRCCMQPSASNSRAMRSYEKAGFRKATAEEEAELRRLAPPDTPDALYMVRDLGAH